VNDFDRAARYAVKNGPQDAVRWLFPRLPASLSYRRWLDAQSAPRPGEPDRRCDTILELDDQAGQPWACVVELFTEPDSDAIDRAVEYLGRFRGEPRHGPHGRDKYPFAVALVFLTGSSAETRLDMNLPGMGEVGLWFGPRVMDVSGEDAVAHLDAIEQNVLGRWLLVWTPLMKGGQTIEVARRWRTLAEADTRIKMMADVAGIFARLTECETVWREALEGIMLKTSPLMEEARQEGRIETARKAVLKVLESRFPVQVPALVVQKIKAETILDVLDGWLGLVSTESLEKIQSEIK
jgi:hypothetical protein